MERSDNPGSTNQNKDENPERVRQSRNPFRVQNLFCFAFPGFSLRSNPGLKLANAFGVKFKLHYCKREDSDAFQLTPKASLIAPLTPKALANFSPGLERSDNPGSTDQNKDKNPVRVRQSRNPFRVQNLFCFAFPGFSLRSNPGLKLANAFGVKFKLHYCK
ncbi:MAG TPA: hypothetical protein VLB46_19450, partial [Pyrinomonadaceae bacterium]|nr:hypothetical protein [Pyrinomonadaceae bacterium]